VEGLVGLAVGLVVGGVEVLGVEKNLLANGGKTAT